MDESRSGCEMSSATMQGSTVVGPSYLPPRVCPTCGRCPTCGYTGFSPTRSVPYTIQDLQRGKTDYERSMSR